MKVRQLARWCVPTALAATLAFTAPAMSAPEQAARNRLPECAPGPASTEAPTGPAGPSAPGACRAGGRVLESGVGLSRPGWTEATPSGYHHLGANTGGEWSGVSGRFSVVDGSVRPNTYDFVAGRFMAKRALGRGAIAWLEAGWAETGWAGAGRQHIYTFNTNTKTWQFYDQYALRPGDRVWLDLHSDTDGVWGAWLWWNNRWNLLTAQRLPIGASAYIEQYVEVHVDPTRPTRVDVPAVTVDNVQLRPPGGGEPRFWRDDVPTLTGTAGDQTQRSGGFCLDWLTRYDTWTAGDCSPEDGGAGGTLLSPTPPNPLPSGDADVVAQPDGTTTVPRPTVSTAPEPASATDPSHPALSTTRVTTSPPAATSPGATDRTGGTERPTRAEPAGSPTAGTTGSPAAPAILGGLFG